MSFLQLVLSLDKTKEEIILLWRICQFDRYRNMKNIWYFHWSVFKKFSAEFGTCSLVPDNQSIL